jgi:hypothetical protein
MESELQKRTTKVSIPGMIAYLLTIGERRYNAYKFIERNGIPLRWREALDWLDQLSDSGKKWIE